MDRERLDEMHANEVRRRHVRAKGCVVLFSQNAGRSGRSASSPRLRNESVMSDPARMKESGSQAITAPLQADIDFSNARADRRGKKPVMVPSFGPHYERSLGS